MAIGGEQHHQLLGIWQANQLIVCVRLCEQAGKRQLQNVALYTLPPPLLDMTDAELLPNDELAVAADAATSCDPPLWLSRGW